jgi:hypothetical protein
MEVNELKRRILEPKAWKIKYFTEASVSLDQEEREIKGINDSMFSSRAAQIINQ